MERRHPQSHQVIEFDFTWSDGLRLPPRQATGSSSLLPTCARIDFRLLRSLVTIRQVLALVAWEPVGRARGSQLRGPCPVHRSGDGSRVFSVNLEKNIYRCFKCGSQGNQLDLHVALTRLPVREAALDLCRRLAIEPPTLPPR